MNWDFSPFIVDTRDTWDSLRTAAAWEHVRHNKPRARQFYSRVLDRYLWRVHCTSMYDGCGTTLDGALRVFRANNQLT